ncbi:MAG: flavodoxin domain-containing protein [Methanohalobium sp.]|uniref:flavodoxin domain-containing protein n=1 Tax=Methanohalobium sp. TaxID=2837493 RepID=UPI00397C97B3
MAKLVVVYLSTQGNTKIMAEAIANGARSRHIDVDVNSFYDTTADKVATVDAIAIGSSTFFYGMLAPIEKFVDELVQKDVSGKVGAAFGSYGWSGEAPHMIADKMRKAGMDVIDPVLRIQHRPNEKDISECERLGKDLAEKIRHH